MRNLISNQFTIQMMKVLIALLCMAFTSGQMHDSFGGSFGSGNNFISGGTDFISGGNGRFSSDFSSGFDQGGKGGGFSADFIGSPALGVGPSPNDIGFDNTGLGVSLFDGLSGQDRSGSWGSQGSGFSSWDNGGFDSNIGRQDFFGGGSQWNTDAGPGLTSGGFNDFSSRPSRRPNSRRGRY